MMHPATELRRIDDDVGHGVFATRPIPRGTVTWILCRLDMVFTPAEAAAFPAPYQPIIDKYAYLDAAGNRILCWDNARFINHSCDPAMLGVGTGFEIAVRDIAAGEQITCDYGGMNLIAPLACRCGAPGCRGSIDADDVLRTWRDRDRLLGELLPLARGVEQPLLAFSDEAALFWSWVDGRAPVPSHRAYRGVAEAVAS